MSSSGPSMAAPVPKLHICFVSVNAVRVLLGQTSGFGGAETELINLASQLAVERDVRVSLVTTIADLNGPTQIRGIHVLPVAPSSSRVASFGFVRRKLTAMGYYWRFARALWGAAPDAYFGKLASIETIITFIISRLRRRVFCYRVEHDWETDPALVVRHIFNGRRMPTRLFSACLRRADFVVCQTVKQKEALLLNYGVRAVIINNSHVIPPPSSEGLESRPQVLWVGRAHSMKRPMLFLELARRLPEFSFSIVMWRDPAFAELFDQVVAESGKLANVTFNPGVPQASVGELYQSARLFVLTSDAEGFSNTLIEAMKAGCPILSFLLDFDQLLKPLTSQAGPGESDLSSEPAVGFCTEGDFERLVEETRRLCTRDGFWSECSVRAREYAASNFDVQVIAPLYISTIRRLVFGHEFRS